jgi:hypothetical protein
MKHTHDDGPAAMEYAAQLLEQLDAGGTLPGLLRQYAAKLAAAEAERDAARAWSAAWKRMAGVRRMQSMARANLWDMISDERDALRAECERLRLALAPFARFGEAIRDRYVDDAIVASAGTRDGTVTLTARDAEQARVALGAPGEENDHAIPKSD